MRCWTFQRVGVPDPSCRRATQDGAGRTAAVRAAGPTCPADAAFVPRGIPGPGGQHLLRVILLNRTERLAAITLYLLARGRVTASDIARAFEVSERTVYRDLQALGEGGLPVVALPGAGGGYELPADYRLMPLTLTPDEAVALWAAVQAFGAAQHPLREAAQGAWLRIQAALPDDLRRHIAEMGSGLEVSRMFPEVQVSQALFATFVRGLRERRQLHIRYHVPPTGELSEQRGPGVRNLNRAEPCEGESLRCRGRLRKAGRLPSRSRN